MTQVYQDLQQTAEDLITQFGQRHYLVQTSGPAGSRTVNRWPCEAVQQNVTDRQVAGQTVKNRTATLLVTSAREPTSKDRIEDPSGLVGDSRRGADCTRRDCVILRGNDSAIGHEPSDGI